MASLGTTATAAAETTPAHLKGRLGHLTPEEEQALRDMWKLVLQACGVHPDHPPADAGASGGAVPELPPTPTTPTTPTTPGDAPKRRWPSLWGAGKAKTPEPPGSPGLAPGGGVEDDAQFLRAASKFASPAALRAAFWGGMKLDDPDAQLLRFLRARRFVVRDALRMMFDNLHWRTAEMDVDGILAAGDGAAAADEKSSDPAKAKAGKEFLHQMRIGKSVVRGVDRLGRPICTIRAREHFAKAQDFEVLKRWIVYLIETARLGFEGDQDRSTVIFDLTGVGMSNVDLNPVWFIAKAFEANYPEMLNRVIVHKAPGFFPYFFNLIIRQLKEEIQEKIDFTNSPEDLATHIDPATIPSELGGPVNFNYAYVEPVPGENALMADTAARDALLRAREDMAREWEALTLGWLALSVPSDAASPAEWAASANAQTAALAQRRALAARLRAGYWALDPYVRARSVWDRLGYLRPDGSIDYYAADKAQGARAAEAGKEAEAKPEAVETGAPVAAQA